MPRKKFIAKRDLKPDPRFNDVLIQKFINKLMWDGKKIVAENIFYSAIDTVCKDKKEDPADIFKKALDNVRPLVLVKSTRIGGATYQVPTEISLDKSQAIAMKWLITFARNRSEKGMPIKLAAEIDDAFNKRGNTFKKREDTHKMADANKAFAHFKW